MPRMLPSLPVRPRAALDSADKKANDTSMDR